MTTPDSPVVHARPAPDSELRENVAGLLEALVRLAPERSPKRALELVGDRLLRAGLSVEREPSALLGKLEGTMPPIVLVSHLEVPPANAAFWRGPPHQGFRRGGALVGRGVLEALHRVALDVVALETLTAGARDGRAVWVLVVDKPVSGTRAALERWPALKDAALAVGPSGFVVEDFTVPGRPALIATHAEVGRVRLTLSARSPEPNVAPARLVRAVERVNTWDRPVTLSEPVSELLDDVARTIGGLDGWLLSTFKDSLGVERLRASVGGGPRQ